jgi:hypothetical protein
MCDVFAMKLLEMHEEQRKRNACISRLEESDRKL